MKEFEKLGIIGPILKSLEEQKFEKPSEIQEKAIPVILKGKDVIAGSATGSGKTLAFGSGIIQNTKKGDGIKALILTPTRELAEQVANALKKFSKYNPLNITPIYGGVSISPQMDDLRKADIVVGTPGRILDHLERRTLNLKKVNTLVLDEADRMLDMGFIEDVERIISQCGKERQTLLFSATISNDITYLAKRYMKNPVKISVESNVDPKKLKQIYYDTPDNMKFSLLVHLIKNEDSGLVMVFCNTQRNTDFVAKNLKYNKIDALAIHGGFTQAKRNRTLEQFHSKNTHVMVCTDVAARGLDIPHVSHVYNYDSPKESKQYVHRIGRTARAGKEGIAINIISSRDHENFSRVLSEQDVNIEKVEVPQVERIMIKRMDSNRGGGFRGRSEGGYQGGGRRERGNFGNDRRPSRGGDSRGGQDSGPRQRSSRRGKSWSQSSRGDSRSGPKRFGEGSSNTSREGSSSPRRFSGSSSHSSRGQGRGSPRRFGDSSSRPSREGSSSPRRFSGSSSRPNREGSSSPRKSGGSFGKSREKPKKKFYEKRQ
ncbi:MAG: DEAD/DEAH box helicase [Candidatus Woesearchaeota archaeon]|jgi:ATP-dependent RNA helicase DeaD|nr:DEAD/DEAH box helicase [Candidatus Woesearchaeota archaeon]